jgi:hypothetical protein
MRGSSLCAAAVALSAGLTSAACKEGPRAVDAVPTKSDVELSAAGFFDVMKKVHAAVPAAATLTADEKCPPEVGTDPQASTKRRDLPALEHLELELFATDGASAKQRGVDAGAVRRASETFTSDARFHEFRERWYGGRREQITDPVTSMPIVYVAYKGQTLQVPYVAVYLPVSRREPELVDGATYTAGQLDGWIVIADTRQAKPVCHVRFTASNDSTISYRAKDNPASYLWGDLEDRWWGAAAKAVDSIAPGAIIYERAVKDGNVVKYADL